MKTIGIVAEYNPFHTGHAWHIQETRRQFREETAVVAVISGNWVQRGECAVTDKWTRTEAALAGGVDLVLELPTVWATASAEGFARGAVAILAATGVVDTLSFGSECGEIAPLCELARCLNSLEFSQALRRVLGPKQSSPSAAAGRWSLCWVPTPPPCWTLPTTTWGWSICAFSLRGWRRSPSPASERDTTAHPRRTASPPPPSCGTVCGRER